jgi:hypothetical protein
MMENGSWAVIDTIRKEKRVPLDTDKFYGFFQVYCPAAVKKYYPGKTALELLCMISGPNITLDKITVLARILFVKVP